MLTENTPEETLRHEIINTLSCWPVHARTVFRQSYYEGKLDFIPIPDSTLMKLIQDSIIRDQETIKTISKEGEITKEHITTLQDQLRKCREAGNIHAVETPAQEAIASA